MLAWWMAAISLLAFIVTLVAIPMAIIRLPEDYFVAERQHQWLGKHHHPALRIIWEVFKSVLGVSLIIVGFLMLVLPGQGIITILVGIMLLRFPGKRRLQRWIIMRKQVLRSANWLRRRAGRAPLKTDLKH